MQSTSPTPLSVLVLDDDENILRLLKIFLAQKGYHVFTAKDGQTGLRKLMTQSFDLLIVDVQMPKLDGMTFAREAKAMWPWLRMIFCTGYYNSDVQKVADELGITEILKKPLSFNTLEDSIQKCFPEKSADSPLIMHTPDEQSCAHMHRLRSYVRQEMKRPKVLEIFRATCDLMMELIPCERASVYAHDDEATYFLIHSKGPCPPEQQQKILMEIHRKFDVMGEGHAFVQPPVDVREGTAGTGLPPEGTLQGMTMPVPHPKHLAGFLHLELPADAPRPSPHHQTLLCISHHLSLILDELDRARSVPRLDVLTGFMNRKWMERRIADLWEQRHRGHASPALMLVDIDDLKSLNDDHGMEQGNQLLVLLSECLKAQLEPGMEAARMGGDTFGILFVDAAEEHVAAVDRQIRQDWTIRLDNQDNPAFKNRTISLGHVLMETEHIHSGLELVECAEQALQTAKREGAGTSLSWSQLCNSDDLNYDRHSVLVVDDDPQVFHLIQRMLNPNIYRVTGAASVAEAVNLMEKGNKFHLLMTDIALPHQDGTVMMDLASKIDPELMMVVISGQLSDDSDSKLRGLGAFEIIQKPFDLKRVRHVVNSALETRTRSVRLTQKAGSGTPSV